MQDTGALHKEHDPHAKPPEAMKKLFKFWRQASGLELERNSTQIVSDVFLENAQTRMSAASTKAVDSVPVNYEQTLRTFCASVPLESLQDLASVQDTSRPAVEVSSMPGMSTH